jgi:RimJ/RimL family protein N-acetyltransferase
MYLSVSVAFTDLELKQVLVEVIVGNDAAIGLYESIGFIRGETIFNRAEHKNGPVDVIAMSLTRDDWDERRDEVKTLLVANNLING